MWIFLNNAMLSIVAHRDDEDTLLVRARVEGDIERVFPAFETYTDETADYLYRADIPRSVVASTIAELALNINYDNFKNSIPKGDWARKAAYSDVWAVMHHLQFTTAIDMYEDARDG